MTSVPTLPSSNWQKLKSRNETDYKSNKSVKTSSNGSSTNVITTQISDLWFDDIKKRGFNQMNESSSRESSLISEVSSTNNKTKIGKYIAIDCEMVGVGAGGVQSALARVTIVNYYGVIILDKYVRPIERVTDFRTEISGITPKLLVNSHDFNQVQQEVYNIIKDRVVIGHALHHDFKMLMLDHPRKMIRDTSLYEPFRQIAKGKTPSLKRLASEELGMTIQTGRHSSVEDAQVCMLLYRKHKEQTLTAPEGTTVEFPELENVFNARSTESSINIFDFDGTLFSSPEPNSEIWENRLVGMLKEENKVYKGWYQDKRSLDIETGNRWNNRLVETVKLSMRTENNLTVLLTGRNFDEFNDMITEMVERKGMKFDVMGFKPSNNNLDWQSYYKTHIIKTVGNDIYQEIIMKKRTIKRIQKLTTKIFKTNFIEDLILHHPSTISINIWEDRYPHLKAFEKFLRDLKILGKIKEGNVHKVNLSKIHLEPFAEYDLVMGMVKDHNEHNVMNRIGIVRKIQYAGIFFDDHVIDQLKKTFPPPETYGEWVFEGSFIHIRTNTNNEWLNSNCGGRGAIVTMRVTAVGIYQERIYCLRVSEYENSQARTPQGMRKGRLYSDCPVAFINFAYVKDSGGFANNTEIFNFNWVPIEHEKQLVIQGVIAAKFILGLA
ncbi:8867_t:CDS:2 [Funneliformis geosporum]|uniref:RNA exonuclease 4 n=1 Tax=Funneliformis geosporum TaxID=1117311 RepID=A0A9W4WKS8_9GLOM|nr:5514_t:CDS:2 [Funneliformis geosporum]CAI2169208.1 8867_t:CDS:2 [Funneliformis geosporum]